MSEHRPPDTTGRIRLSKESQSADRMPTVGFRDRDPGDQFVCILRANCVGNRRRAAKIAAPYQEAVIGGCRRQSDLQQMTIVIFCVDISPRICLMSSSIKEDKRRYRCPWTGIENGPQAEFLNSRQSRMFLPNSRRRRALSLRPKIGIARQLLATVLPPISA